MLTHALAFALGGLCMWLWVQGAWWLIRWFVRRLGFGCPVCGEEKPTC